MTTAAATRTKGKIDIPGFVDHLREVNREAVRISRAPLRGGNAGKLLSLRRDLVAALDELEQTVQILRIAAGAPPSTSSPSAPLATDQLVAARQDDTGTFLILDTTEAMINDRHLVTPVEFQYLMGWSTRQAVWKAAESNRTFYLSYRSERYFPAFYGDPLFDRKQLETVTKVLGDLPGGAKLQFFLTRKGSLGGVTPLQALAAGNFAKVKDVASAFAETPVEA
ncbi:hypothetical protein WAE61_07465 [Comamonadaceae bacterium PP-2]